MNDRLFFMEFTRLREMLDSTPLFSISSCVAEWNGQGETKLEFPLF